MRSILFLAAEKGNSGCISLSVLVVGLLAATSQPEIKQDEKHGKHTGKGKQNVASRKQMEEDRTGEKQK
jgi:hypothetical protein